MRHPVAEITDLPPLSAVCAIGSRLLLVRSPPYAFLTLTELRYDSGRLSKAELSTKFKSRLLIRCAATATDLTVYGTHAETDGDILTIMEPHFTDLHVVFVDTGRHFSVALPSTPRLSSLVPAPVVHNSTIFFGIRNNFQNLDIQYSLAAFQLSDLSWPIRSADCRGIGSHSQLLTRVGADVVLVIMECSAVPATCVTMLRLNTDATEPGKPRSVYLPHIRALSEVKDGLWCRFNDYIAHFTGSASHATGWLHKRCRCCQI